MTGRSKMTEAQRTKLMENVHPGDRVLEVGTWHGATISMLAEAQPEAAFVSVDIFRHLGPENWFANRRDNMTVYVGTVQELRGFAAPESFDLVIVDADHTYPVCYRDLCVAVALVKRDGKIFAHDYDTETHRWPGVIKSVTKFCAKHNWRVIGSTGTLVEMERGPE